ncbi:tetratricopeptide repeat protein [Rhodoferax sp. AJA081-3]|uniref:tetratricopeptide repeat protein n=1 Tax=Rhodoferax sp. AJA081-3 TaxID=2752316 RepID=UPI001AE03BD5|nr:tetratricopeptide repeat protein [Rhodoferax sp. AJA081-3]QTN30171.1 tetratricopeptide repeat protein [Rhodoferax sp. AJA081-3]
MPIGHSNIETPTAIGSRLERLLLVWRAKALLFLGMRGAAKGVFLEVVKRWPDDVLALNSLAYDAVQSRQPATALDYYARVLTLQPQVSNAHFNHAFVAEELGQIEIAEQGFRAALRIEEKMDRAWYGLGLVLVRQGRLDEALDALKRNTKLQPMSPFGWYQMARVHVDLQQPEEARAVIRHLKGFEPKVAAQLERETGLKVPSLV